MDQRIHSFFIDVEKMMKDFGFPVWDAYVDYERQRHISMMKQQVEDFVESEQAGFALRVLKDQKLCLVYGNVFEPNTIMNCMQKLVSMQKFMTPD